ncbi:MAG TPA: HEAT repeat domain-containing protein [Planctomycetota bacterium]|nr:HEAT repeat domain-containing protein [Planctomycetota bacterium]
MRVLALALLLAGCAGVESDIDRAEMGIFFENFIKGKDRGLGAYSKMIESHATKVQNGRYQYVEPAHISNFYIDLAARGLGGTKVQNAVFLAAVVDRLLFVLAFDPTGAVRSTACDQLGRVLLRLPATPPPAGVEGNPDIRINQIADDLQRLAADFREGKQVPVADVVERMRALAQESPRSTIVARQVVRVLCTEPISNTATAQVREASEEITPPMLQGAITVVMRNAAVGLAEEPSDDSPLVREAAIDVLTRVASGIAREGAIARLGNGIDPPETDPDVRCALLTYLGRVGGPGAFECCVGRLDDIDINVRYAAQAALQEITGARVDPTSPAWLAWAESRKQQPAKAAE